jgi:prefoldin subunit 5
MSASGDVQQLYAQLQEVDRLLNKINTEIDTAAVKSTTLHVNLDRVNRVLSRSLALIQRLSGGNEDLSALISKMQQVIVTMNMLRNAALLLQAGLGPVGWVLMGIGVATTALSIQEDIDNTFRSVQA